MRLIDADSLEKKLTDSLSVGYDTENYNDIAEAFCAGLMAALYELEHTPTIEAEPVRHGKWERVIATAWSKKVSCSICRYAGHNRYHYCPQCGAKMEEEE